MSKRRINKQQSARIEKMQAGYREQENLIASDQKEGLVITRYSRHAEIEDSTGNRVLCTLRRNIDSLVAGDRVVWQPSGLSEKKGVILSCYPRTSELKRSDKYNDNKAVAANITQLLVVIAAKPEPTWPLLDSYIVMAEYLGLQLTIICNKMDLPSEALKKELLECYQPLGYNILFTCKENSLGYEQLFEVLRDHTSVFVGQSGVGKSSLIAGILPHETSIVTADISTISELGCHTTSNSRLYHLPTGGALIDSPGIREFGLCRMPPGDLIYGFREFRDLASLCKFRNCNHLDSPDCALLNAVDKGHVSRRRYENLIKLTTQFIEEHKY